MNNNEVKEHDCEIVCLNDFICSDCSKEEIEACPHKQLLQLQVENEQLTQKLEKVREYLNAIVNGTHFTEDLSGHLIELAQQALKELE